MKCMLDPECEPPVREPIEPSEPPPVLPITPLINNSDNNRFNHLLYTAYESATNLQGSWLVTRQQQRYICKIDLVAETSNQYASDCFNLDDFVGPLVYDTGTFKLTGIDIWVSARDRPSRPKETVTSVWTLDGTLFAPGKLNISIHDESTIQIEGQPDQTESGIVHTSVMTQLNNSGYSILGQITVWNLVLPDDTEWLHALSPNNYLPDLQQVLQNSISQPAMATYPVTRFLEKNYPDTARWTISFYNDSGKALQISGTHIWITEEDQTVYLGAENVSAQLGNDTANTSQTAPVPGNGKARLVEWLQNDANGIRLQLLYHEAGATTWDDVKYVEADISWR